MKSTLPLAAAALLAASPAFAQDTDTYRIRVGLGAQVQPKFLGADSSRVLPLPALSVAKGDELFGAGAPDDHFSIKLVSTNGFSFGPVGNLQSGRKNKDARVDIGRIKTTIEGGAFAQYQPSESFRLRGELRKGFNGHEGLVGSVGGDYIWRSGDRYVVTLGPRVLWSDSRFQRAFFGVTPAASLATGLPEYRPGGGIHAVAATSGANVAISKDFGLFGYARYERLVGDAAKSPFIRTYGSRDQFSGGIGLSYTFGLRR